ncbi:3-hydroxyacyl-CoA dehydrogenase [Pseudooceanicola sediminis]|uniref:3-hydroxyacyl-CoA dehydrogenase n=1 Tax=Pseudooceanicola sediminis TaxID=2211117 RepID=A0A399J2Q3_9RHOB|nr:3-hydroxyacyl-CoA dehydrogenase NAD-binding domain-containing protein [Pseudooceanicola sediminis]KAA2315102.1 3-hydroxyacyl-CoA dehydrogenase [Puniceibacterium sp. HSS470]RII38917.1 3-hydroxyacyl-CoA dehydrogenase [Pseudooceanicola sediminis]|tara:strand:+ start:50830 stop:52788 length:1959 start_codon:yes stop_codon:yes gene_type:complete
MDTLTQPLVRSVTEDGIATLTIDRPPANALSQDLRAAILAALDHAAADTGVEGVILACAGKTFIAGAEISELGLPLSPTLPEVLERIEGLGKPVAAALHGTALGGGFEVALACGLRVARADSKIGLPEVRLGILPGSGGTVRATRLAGAEVAQTLAGSGEMMPVETALTHGLVDEVVPGDPVEAAAARLRALIADGTPPALVRNRMPAIAADTDQLELLAAAQQRKLRAPTPRVVLQSILNAQSLPFDEALTKEREIFLDAVASPTSAALRHLFFAERAAAKSGIDRSVAARGISSVCVIGAGTMGRGIAMAFADAGFSVTLCDLSQDALDAALAAIGTLYDGMAAKGRIAASDAEGRKARIATTTDLATQIDCDLFVEAAFEDMGVKKSLFAQLDAVAKPGAILATNTSYLNVNEIAAATSRPQDVLGLHFFSPANIMKLLEVVQTTATAPDVLQTASLLAKRLNKQAVTVGVCRGFVGNRMLQARNRAVPQLLCEGATPAQIDEAFRALGWPMGPCEVQDLSGLDIAWRMRKAEGLSEPVADTLCERGRLGQKAGKGWYDYVDGKKQPSDEVYEVVAAIATGQGIRQRQITAEEIIARTHDPMIAEGEALLAEGIARSRDDIDVVWVNGYGFPRALGGPMYWDANGRPKA